MSDCVGGDYIIEKIPKNGEIGGAICLVNSDNERDSSLLNRWRVLSLKFWVRSSSGPGSALLPGSSSGVFFSSSSSAGFSESVGGGGAGSRSRARRPRQS